ncbi:MAG TPA: hypothetical protein VGM86_14225 [Thermoanaerobaculia bacterium]
MLFVLTLLAGGNLALAQADSPHASNAVFLELLGNGGVVSLNYERLVNDRLALRVGYGTWKDNALFGPSNEQQASSMPVSASYLFGPGERKLEIGGGITFGHRESLDGTKSSFRSLTAIVGYRTQPAGRGYLFRAGVTPFYSLDSGSAAYPNPGFSFSAGVSFGYRF